jgi:hypothetical protein
MDETGSGSSPVVGFGISGVERSGSVTRQLNEDGSSGNTFQLQSEGTPIESRREHGLS